MERIVRKVEATRHMHTLAPLSMPTVRKTACYIRVSTLDESQDTSFQAQRAHFTELIENSPDMVFAGLYADDGISGTGTAHRQGFQNMVRDARWRSRRKHRRYNVTVKQTSKPFWTSIRSR